MKEQYIKIDEHGAKFYYSDKEMTVFHREDGPAVEWADGYKAWCINNKLHREDGPAIERVDGTRCWYVDGTRHREDGPAVEDADGRKVWWVNGERHREDGPAVERTDGSKAWFINGKEFLTEDEFNDRNKPVEFTLDEIAEKMGVSVDLIKIKK